MVAFSVDCGRDTRRHKLSRDSTSCQEYLIYFGGLFEDYSNQNYIYENITSIAILNLVYKMK